jgi:dihydropteroate synthase-like protein
VVTGHEAFQEIEFIDWTAVKKKYDVNFAELPILIAAFISPTDIMNFLEEHTTAEYDMILVSGLIPWNLDSVHHPSAAKLRKGPESLAMLPEILLNYDLNKLNRQTPANLLYSRDARQNLEKLIQEKRNFIQNHMDGSSFSLSTNHPEIIFSPDLPPILIGEILDAPRHSFELICQKIEYYLREGINIIDIGAIVNENHAEDLAKLIRELKRKYQVPLAIDSTNPEEIKVAVTAGAEMILSINPDNIDSLLDLPKDLPVVVIPISFSASQKPPTPSERVARLMQLGSRLSAVGFTKIILDPIMNAPIQPGMVTSIETLALLHQGLQEIPDRDEDGTPLIKPHLFLGAANAVELIDADSPGLNAFMAVLAAELGITAILTNEYSNKGRKSIAELKESLLLTYYAKIQHVTPINLGIDALRLKAKVKPSNCELFDKNIVHVAPATKTTQMDPLGYFKIGVDLINECIVVTHFTNRITPPEPTKSFTGTDAESIYKQIIEENLISRLDHAAYLGKELMRAEFTLKFGTRFQAD